ncbi:helix-turn-helix transcriptional regulator [Paenibacillus sp. YIM B09110]|uniref:helix-turn-helix transcriptional regulator n=1 Tax=Paenibacillus sp. YIM B09110 TaxID=3126102 RepID=UPI00301DA03A
MQRQSHLLTLSQTPYFCLPESVGAYSEYPEHHTIRAADAHNTFNIHYVASGKGYVEWEGKTHQLTQGDAVLYFPMQSQHYYSSKDEPWDVRWVHFYGSGVHDYFLERGLHKSQLWTLRQTKGWEQAHMELLVEAETHRMLHPIRLSTLTYTLLALFAEQAVPLTGSSKASSAGNRILELLPHMQEEAMRPFILEEWAVRAGVTPHYFCKLFKNTMKMTPMDFITRCRLQMAKQWLLDRKEANIGQIAQDAGYPSVSYFNKRFIEHEGMTPTAYRQLFGM